MSLRNNKMLMVGGCICAVILLVQAAVLIWGTVQLAGAKGKLERGQRRLSTLRQRNPYPSEANIQTLEKNLDELEYRVGELAAEMKRDPFPDDAVEAAAFSAHAQDVVEHFRERALQVDMQLPERLEVGFAQYVSGGAVPEAEHVPRLIRQLYSVECVADVLMQSRVASIDSMTRDLFESVDASALPRRRRPNNVPGSNIRIPAASAVGPDGFYYIERIGISFSAREEVVWRVLDGFAAAPHFMVVAEFEHRTRSGILSYNPEAVKLGGNGDDETLRYLSEGILSGAKALSRPERIISGNELVEVRLVVDVYNFEPKEVER